MNTECPANYDRITKDKGRVTMGQGETGAVMLRNHYSVVHGELEILCHEGLPRQNAG